MSATKIQNSPASRATPKADAKTAPAAAPEQKKASWAPPANVPLATLDIFNRLSPKKMWIMPPLEVGPMNLKQLTIADAQIVPKEDRKTVVDLKVPSNPQAAHSQDCKKKSDESFADLMGWAPDSTHEQRFEIAVAEDHNGRIVPDAEQLAAGREALDKKLDEGQPVVIGVSHSSWDENPNPNKMTDHFVLVKGRNYDDAGRLYYSAMDPGATHLDRRFYVDKQSGKLFAEGNAAADAARAPMLRPFEITTIRIYEKP
jgi:hypothetical protein